MSYIKGVTRYMDFKTNVSLVNKPGNLKGWASITINDEFAVRGLRIMQGEKGLFVAMPSRKNGDAYEDICFPVTAEAREKLNNAVLTDYENQLSQAESQANKKEKKSGKNKQSKKQDNEQKKGADKELSEDGEEQGQAEPEMNMG